MKRLNSAEFRKTFMQLDEPTEVVKYGSRVAGVWLPGESEQSMTQGKTIVERAFAQFRPVPKPGKKTK